MEVAVGTGVPPMKRVLTLSTLMLALLVVISAVVRAEEERLDAAHKRLRQVTELMRLYHN